MVSTSLVQLLHVIGLALAVGAATLKLILLIKVSADPSFLSAYLAVSKFVTRQIVAGIVLVTLSGLAWLVLGYPFTPRLVLKLILVGAIWVLGPVLDNVVEPKFRALAPESGEAPSAAFLAVRKQFLVLEWIATSLFYAVIAIWIFR